jgi:outer membrane immunogenic protein
MRVTARDIGCGLLMFAASYAGGAPALAQGYGQKVPRISAYRAIDQSPRDQLPLYRPNIWEGLYLGAHLGGDFGSFKAPSLAIGSIDATGAAGGLHLGYNWQFNNIVTGFEADGSTKSAAGARTFAGGGRIGGNQDWLASVRLRAGYAAGNVLVYVTGGFAVSENELRISIPGASAKATETMQGYVLGGGIEMKFAPNISGRIEALHYEFSDKAFAFPGGTVRGGVELTTVRAGLTYHFN